MKVHCIDYQQMPGQNPLFLDFLLRYERVGELYPPAHLGEERLQQRAAELLSLKRSYPRARLVPRLRRWNSALGAHERVLEHIQELGSQDCLAVITGQQLGLFGGPSLAVYKAATAVLLCEQLRRSGFRAVPLFWLASDDSDFQEVQKTVFYDDSQLLEVEYPHPGEDPAWMVGRRQLSFIGSCLQVLEAHLQGHFREDVLRLLRECYRPEYSFSRALGSWLTRLFGERGLILFDPLDDGYKEEVAEVFQRVVREREPLLEELQRRSEALRKGGWTPQVQLEEGETFLFWIQEGRRYKLEFREGRYRTKGNRQRQFSPQELLRLIRENPNQVGPNVLLRPVIQDLLFPAVVYVGGPSEIAYFAQAQVLGDRLGVPLAVFPRAGLTFVDRRSQRYLRKHGLQPADIWSSGIQELSHRLLLRREAEGRILQRLGRLKEHLRGELEDVGGEIAPLEPTVADLLRGAQGKMLYQLEKVRNRFVTNMRRRDEELAGQLEALRSRLLPGGKPQERVINFNQFLSEEGLPLAERMLEAIRPFCKAHHVVYL